MNLKKYLFALMFLWSFVISLSLGWNIYQVKQSIINLARTSARISYDKDILYRRWVAMRGGVYVPVSEMTPSNPYLKIPQRDVVTSKGVPLTLVNPAYMNRQVNELAIEMHGFRGHITSLNPLRPANQPDDWERKSLEYFEKGETETSRVEVLEGREYFRLMRPFVTEESCLKCHAAQGYKVGDIRGGISVSIPMSPLRDIENRLMIKIMFAHGILWVIGLAGIVIGTRGLYRQTRQREELKEKLFILSITDTLTGLHNRRGFLSLAAQQLQLADRTKRKLLLFFADLDGMKWINDTQGHEQGDKALIEAASIFKNTFRSSDIIARIGGDEFAVLAVDAVTSNVTPENLVDRLQRSLDAYNDQAKRKYKLSISVGYALYDPDNPLSIDDLMSNADKMMYIQKKNKNRAPH